jgi:hypothetical protein
MRSNRLLTIFLFVQGLAIGHLIQALYGPPAHAVLSHRCGDRRSSPLP